MKSKISIHFDGPIAHDHTVQLRIFSRTLEKIQSAIDRAYLDLKNGNVWKNARLSDYDYPLTEFLVMQTREGGFISDLVAKSGGADIVKRINSAVAPAYEKAKANNTVDSENLPTQAELRRKHYKAGVQEPQPYETFLNNPEKNYARRYGDRSIVKEFDQIAAAIRARGNDGSVLEIDLYADQAYPTLVFDEKLAKAFHDVVSRKSLGDPVLIPVTLRSLDSGNGGLSKGKARNLISGKEFNLFIYTDRGFGSLRSFLKKTNPPAFEIVACPVLEYDAIDPEAGDMYLIDIVKE